jgi:hypothetical protein
MMFVSYQSAFIPIRTTMATQVIKMKSFLSVRVRKNELGQAKFTCPFLKRDGKKCEVLQPFRHLSVHCRKIHKQEVAIKCLVDDCSWWCHISLRCLTSHLSNTETHGALVFNGGPNLDGGCEVVPYEIEEGISEYHTVSCSVSTRDLTRFRAKMLKREERAIAARMVKPVVVGTWPAPKSEKENFFNFGIQFKQLMAEETGEFDNWETLNKILKANNMRYCEESLKLLGQK